VRRRVRRKAGEMDQGDIQELDTLHIVVSAKKGVTDRLVKESSSMSDRKKASHQIQGEIESARKLCSELAKIKVDSSSFTGAKDYPLSERETG